MTPDDEEFLRRAIALAWASRDEGQAPYGSLLVGPDGRVLAEDHNTVLADGDIAAHPEQKLARWAARELDRTTAAATTMYTSSQPCRMCTGPTGGGGWGGGVSALRARQSAGLSPASAAPPVLQEGPFLFDEAVAVLDGYER